MHTHTADTLKALKALRLLSDQTDTWCICTGKH